MTAQTLITSTTGVIAISTAAGGNNRLKPSTYTPLVPKTAILRVTTRCSQILRPSTVWGGQLYPLKTRILVAAGFVETKESYKNQPDFQKSESHDKHIFGSMFFEAQSRNVWEMVKSTGDDDNSIAVGLYHKKPPPFGKLHQPLGYKFTFDNDNNETYFEYNDPKNVDELLERMGTNTKIIEALKAGPLTPKELEDKGIKNPRTPLSRLKKKGIVTLIGKETYGLVDTEHTQD